MSDTQIFGRTLTGDSKKMLLYAFVSVCLAIGGACMAMDQKEWDAMWWMKKTGWLLLLLGNVGNTIKAYYSNPTTTSVSSNV